MRLQSRLWSLSSWVICTTVVSWPLPRHIGDGKVSDASNKAFFLNMDSDQDGMVERHEIREALVEYGGVHLDEQDEIDGTVDGIFSRIDSDKDSTLSLRDLSSYWDHFAATLTVEETVDWVVHSVQLPQEVGEQFREAGVTGIEFADLIANDGAALLDEIGIEKKSHHRKLKRAIKMMLTGVGTAPDQPSPFKTEVESCSVVSLEWAKAGARQFKVHKYRVLRRTHKIMGGGKLTDWDVIYDGPESRFKDTSVSPGSQYDYRVNSWNLFGKSEAVIATVITKPVTSCTMEALIPLETLNFMLRCFTILGPAVTVLLFFLQFIIRCVGREHIYSYAAKIWFGISPIMPKMLKVNEKISRHSSRGTTVGTEHLDVLPDEVTRNIRRAKKANLPSKTAKCYICKAHKLPWHTKQHFCRECNQSFCTNCGETCHSSFTSCPVKGNCRCRNCLNKKSPETSEPTPGTSKYPSETFKPKPSSKLWGIHSSNSPKVTFRRNKSSPTPDITPNKLRRHKTTPTPEMVKMKPTIRKHRSMGVIHHLIFSSLRHSTSDPKLEKKERSNSHDGFS